MIFAQRDVEQKMVANVAYGLHSGEAELLWQEKIPRKWMELLWRAKIPGKWAESLWRTKLPGKWRELPEGVS